MKVSVGKDNKLGEGGPEIVAWLFSTAAWNSITWVALQDNKYVGRNSDYRTDGAQMKSSQFC
jgi:hypothetical protein